MLGWDQCSPSAKQDSQGGECLDTCQEMEVEGKVKIHDHGYDDDDDDGDDGGDNDNYKTGRRV